MREGYSGHEVVLGLSFSPQLSLGEPPKDPADLASYDLPSTEEELLACNIPVGELFGQDFNLEEGETLMSYLTVPYLR